MGGLDRHVADVGEHLSRDALLLAQEPEDEMLRPDVTVAELMRLVRGECERLLRLRRIRQMCSRLDPGPSFLHCSLDRSASFFRIDPEALEHRRTNALAFEDQPEQHVLRANVLVLKS